MKLDPQPSAGVVDSQSVKSSAEERGYDGGKNVKGPKRHILVDTEGFVLKAKVPNSAKVMDYEGIKTLLCGGQIRTFRASLTCGWMLATVERIKARIGHCEDFGMERGSPRACAQGCSEGRADGVGQGVG